MRAEHSIAGWLRSLPQHHRIARVMRSHRGRGAGIAYAAVSVLIGLALVAFKAVVVNLH
jgi:hypothetical protein